MTSMTVSEAKMSNPPSLRCFKPFETLTQTVIEALEEASDFRNYKKDETIASLSQYEGESFFVVEQGSLKVTIAHPHSLNTNEIMISIIEAGSAFGMDIVLGDSDMDLCTNIAINAADDASVWIIDAHAFRKLINDRPSLAKNLLFYLAKDTVKARFSAVEDKSAPEQRIFSLLLESVERDDVLGYWHIPKMPKHRELAMQANVEETDAASAIAYLIQEDIAQRNYPGLIIGNMEALNRLSQ